MGTMVESVVRVSDEEMRVGSWGWDGAAEKYVVMEGRPEERLEGPSQAVQTKKHL